MTAPRRPDQSATPSTIAQTERVVLTTIGAFVAFVGFVVLLLGGFPILLRLAVGLPVALVGVLLCWLGMRPPMTEEHLDITPQALLAIERMALAPLAVISVVGFFVIVLRTALTPWVRVPLALSTLLLSLVLGWVSIVNRLPERVPQPDRTFEHTED